MATSIQVDDEVQLALARRAAENGLDLFSPSTPNLILRIEFGLDQSLPSDPIRFPTSSVRSASPDTPENVRSSPRTTGRSHQRIGPRLLREHGLDCAKGYFSKTGIPYQKPSSFPAVFFDINGYCIVNDEVAMQNSPHINVGKQVSIPRGIYSIPGYVRCQHTHS